MKAQQERNLGGSLSSGYRELIDVVLGGKETSTRARRRVLMFLHPDRTKAASAPEQQQAEHLFRILSVARILDSKRL